MLFILDCEYLLFAHKLRRTKTVKVFSYAMIVFLAFAGKFMFKEHNFELRKLHPFWRTLQKITASDIVLP